MNLNDITHAFALPGAEGTIDLIHPSTGRGLYSDETLEQVRLRYPGAEILLLADFLAAKAARQDAPVEWEQIDEEKYEYYMNVLPPVDYDRHGFLVGEPTDHHARTGRPRFQACVIRGGRFYTSNRPLTRAEFKTLTAEAA